MTARHVVGADLSANSSGIALSGGDTIAVLAPKPATKKRTVQDDLNRLLHAHAVFTRCLDRNTDVVAIEDYAVGIRGEGGHRLAEIGGVFRLAVAQQTDAEIVLVNGMHLKIYACGSARADLSGKPEMAAAAREHFGREFDTDDEVDAFWLRALVLDYLGEPLAPLPPTHRRALDEVKWPASLQPLLIR